tara:strand:+ start:451 stop:894 length:444 start_codon:yes stop_codon:yes gene_type:complete
MLNKSIPKRLQVGNLVEADIDDHWEDIINGLYQIKQESNEPETFKDYYDACKKGQAILWVDKDVNATNAFLITQLLTRNYSMEKYLLLWVAWYKEESGAYRVQQDLEVIARMFGCKSIEFWTSRPEIMDYGKAHGYDKVTYKCVKEV